MWECPDFFVMPRSATQAAKCVLLYSTAGKVIWETGELDHKELRFYKERSGLLDHGAYYAQKTQSGEQALWGWILETRPEAEFSAAGWAGCMALPRSLSLDAQNNLRMNVLPEVESLRVRAFNTNTDAAKNSARERKRLVGEIRIENVAGEFLWETKAIAAPFSLTIMDSGGPWWSFRAEAAGWSSTKLQVNEKTIEIPTEASGELFCRLFLDASVAEFFCNRRHAVTTRIYRKPVGPLRVVIGDADAGALNWFDAWQLKPISNDRLTT
jgi:beta-fructofuranosidase